MGNVAPLTLEQGKATVAVEKTKIEDKIEDYLEEGENIPIGSLVCTFAHPFTDSNQDVFISSYLSFTPPIMIVSEKKYGIKYNSISGEKEDNDSYKCFYYSTSAGTIEENWFKRKELKFISHGSIKFFLENKTHSLDRLKKDYLGEMAIMSNVDLELGKKKIWSDSDGDKDKLKINNLLDFLPPLGTIIDFKFSDDYQKYNEKEGKISHRKSKIMVKLRWLNNTTSKYSEEYFPMVGLRRIEKEGLVLKDYQHSIQYLLDVKIDLEGDKRGTVSKIPVQFERVVWNHYYYRYSFINLFTQSSIDSNFVNQQSKLDLSKILNVKPNNWDAHLHFTVEKAPDLKDKWYEIEYSDKNEKYTKRIIKVIDLKEDEKEEGANKRILIANCLLRNGKIRHFRINRIKTYTKLEEDFIKTFID